MDAKTYQELALVTESPIDDALVARASSQRVIRLLHGAIGLATEAAEILDALKKHIFYNRPLDVVNIKEEMGDSAWYTAILCDETQTPLEAIMETNIAKLEARYGDKFSEHRATHRDLQRERQILEAEVETGK